MKDYRNETASALYNLGLVWAVRFLHEKGYTRTELNNVVVGKEAIDLSLTLRDDFQEGEDYHNCFKHGYSIAFTLDEESERRFAEWPGRATRELHVMSRKLGSLVEFRDTLVSASGLAFLEDVIKARDRYLALEAPRTFDTALHRMNDLDDGFLH